MSDFLPPVVARLLGDTKDFASKMSSASGTMDSESGKVESRGARLRANIGQHFTAIGGLVTGAGGLLTEMGTKGAQAEAQLKTAIENTGHSMDDYESRIKKTSNQMMGFGFTQSETQKALAQLTTSTQDPNKALGMMGLAADIAKSKHMSLESASNKLGLAMSGNTRIFKQFGIILPAHATETQKAAAMTELQRRVHGQAAEQADNFGGKIVGLKNHIEAMGESVGQKVGPVLTLAGPIIMGVSQIMGLFSGSSAAAGAAATAMGTETAAAGVEAGAGGAAFSIGWAPVLIAIGLLVAAGYLLYRNWDTVFGFVKGLVMGAYNFVKQHMDLLGAVLLGPLAPLFLIARHWREIWHGIQEVVEGVWHGIGDAVKFGVNLVIDGINALTGAMNRIQIHLPSFHIGPISTPGFDWDGLKIPRIPHMAEGGFALRAGLALVGERGPEMLHLPEGASVAPLSGGQGGNVYNIHVEFTGTVVGADTRRLAQQLVDPLRAELIRTGTRQGLGLPA